MSNPRRTPLFSLHKEKSARIFEFANCLMPLHYDAGILKEHLHTRKNAGLFDISHMGQILLSPLSGNINDVASALEKIVPANIVDLRKGRQRYTTFTTAVGGILDDLIVSNMGSHLGLVVNASRIDIDVTHLRENMKDICDINVVTDRALIAIQGPDSDSVLSSILPSVSDMCFMDHWKINSDFGELWIARSGYTGEDGFEISLPADRALEFSLACLENKQVSMIGLGARDSLRLEAGLCLYGNDLGYDTSPVEAALEWSIPKVRRIKGERAGGFPGDEIILAELETGAKRRRVGLLPEGRAPMREGVKLFPDENSKDSIGYVTSGVFGPTVGYPIAMGYLNKNFSNTGSEVFGDLRGKRISAKVVNLPFLPSNYKR